MLPRVALSFPANVFSCLGILLPMLQRMSQPCVDYVHMRVLRTSVVLKISGLHFASKCILSLKSK